MRIKKENQGRNRWHAMMLEVWKMVCSRNPKLAIEKAFADDKKAAEEAKKDIVEVTDEQNN